jgi:hypothetical protein
VGRIIHYELLERNLTVTAERYRQQLRRLEEGIQQKRHTHCKHGESGHSELDWEILPHTPYSPDLSPSNYHLFRSLSLSNNLRGAEFPSTATLSSKIGSTISLRPNRRISSSV